MAYTSNSQISECLGSVNGKCLRCAVLADSGRSAVSRVVSGPAPGHGRSYPSPFEVFFHREVWKQATTSKCSEFPMITTALP